MTDDPVAVARLVSWVATGLGLALWLYSWFGPGDPIRKRRLSDLGMTLVFAAILLRVVIKQTPLNAFDWFFAVVSPLFIAAALWRLGQGGRRP